MVCYKNIIYGPTANDAVPDNLTNAIIPTTGKPKLEINAVYGDDGVQIVYYEYIVTIETVIYGQATVLADIELEVARLKQILLTPGYTLVIYPAGLGTLAPVLGPKSLTLVPGATDVKGGPYPQNIRVEAIASNNAIGITGQIMFRISHCPSAIEGLLQYNSELDFDVDDEGDMKFNLRTTIQKTTPITDISVYRELVTNQIQGVGASFNGMKRRKRTSWSRDMRVAMIHIEFSDIKSYNAFFPRTRHIDATDELASDLLSSGVFSGKGFMSWNRKISATITLPAGVHKSWAWVVYLSICAERMKKLKLLVKAANILDVAGQAADNKNRFLLTKIKLKDNIYSRTMTFEQEYFVLSDLKELLDKSSIFNKVNTAFKAGGAPEDISEQWRIWTNSTEDELNGQLGYQVDGVPVVYDQCSGVYTKPKLRTSKLLPNEVDYDYTEKATPDKKADEDPKYSWLEYDNGFKFVQEHNNVQVKPLQPVPSNYYRTEEATALATSNNNVVGMSLHGNNSSESGMYLPSKTISRGPTTNKIRMQGYALRVGHKIPIPVLIAANGKAAERTGESRIVQKQVSKSDVPIYLAMWDIEYNIDKDLNSADVLGTIKTSGVAGHYV